MQWEDVCRVAAVRYVPGLALLAAVLLSRGMLGAALPLPWLTAVLIAVVSSLTPIPSQVGPCAIYLSRCASVIMRNAHGVS